MDSAHAIAAFFATVALLPAAAGRQAATQNAPVKTAAVNEESIGDGIEMWDGGGLGACWIIVAGRNLVSFARTHNAAFICGTTRAAVDRMSDPLIQKGPLRPIEAVNFEMQTRINRELVRAMAAPARSRPAGVRTVLKIKTWYELLLLPKAVRLDDIRTLADVQAVGGIRHSRRSKDLTRVVRQPGGDR